MSPPPPRGGLFFASLRSLGECVSERFFGTLAFPMRDSAILRKKVARKSTNLVLAGCLGGAVSRFHIDFRRFLVKDLGARSAGDVDAGSREFNLTIAID